MAITLLRTRVTKAPRSLSFIVVMVGGLALFLIVASLLLISNPFGFTIHEYPLGVDHVRRPSLVLSPCENQTRVPHQWQQPLKKENQGIIKGEFQSISEVPNGLAFAPAKSFHQAQQVGSINNSVSVSGNKEKEVGESLSSGLIDDSIKSSIHSDGLASSNHSFGVEPFPSPPFSNVWKEKLRSCDLYNGKWIYDPAGPLYTKDTCPIIVGSWNCQGNGRPDKDYENWRWRPKQCRIPRFDARKFLEFMRGKTVAFIGDSLARNQMESMLCILWQVEAPKRRRNPHMHQWYFKSTSTTIAIIWSAWLVHKTTEPLPATPQGLLKLHLDTPDETFMDFLPEFDVVIINSGHWFFKQAAYLLKGKIVGGNLWRPKRSRKKQFDNVKAYSMAFETTLTAIATAPNYKGLTIVRTYSPDHHHTGGGWNTGGTCGRMARPGSKLMWTGHTDVMYKKQITGFEQAIKKVRNGSKMRLMNITEVFKYRPDGHPGAYISPDVDIVSKRGSDGKRISKDCGHWCMPGPVDTWNEILFEIIKREL